MNMLKEMNLVIFIDNYFLFFTWTNPDDENFSHVSGDRLDVAIGANNGRILTMVPAGSYLFKCVDKNGNVSKGVWYFIEEKNNPFF